MAFDQPARNNCAELAALNRFAPPSEANTIDVTLKTEEGHVMRNRYQLSRNRRVLRVEVRGASLEDIFVGTHLSHAKSQEKAAT